MGRIQVMSKVLANQIAAGEVVERPSSCVKELVENSLDAGARSILIQLEEGGIQKIRVQDDGDGLDPDDLPLAFARHATSKVRTALDLQRIGTLGFRGEALASIAAVARVTLQSRTREVQEGRSIHVEGSEEVGMPSPVGMQPGTIIQVADLFYNTPARLKYLRTVQTEQARCMEAVQRAAMSRPDVRFRVEVDGRVLFQTPGTGDALAVLAALYGVGEARQLLPISASTADYRVSGYIGRPAQSRSNRSYAHLFVNRRPIRNIAVHQAVVSGYGSRLMVNRHPMYALYIEMDPNLVDVNIHPHKSEVRFSEERDLVQVLVTAVAKALEETFLVPGMDFRHRAAPANDKDGQGYVTPADRPGGIPDRPRTSNDSVQTSFGPALQWKSAGRPHDGHRETQNRPGHPESAVNKEVVEAVYGSASSETAVTTVRESTEVHDTLRSDPEQRPGADWALRPIGQTLGMYILADDGENFYIIDQHAAHERILYERFSKRMAEQSVAELPLLTPHPIHLSSADAAVVTKQVEALAEMGLRLDSLGGASFMLRSIPDIWDGLDAVELATDILSSLAADVKQPDVRSALRERIVLRSCKAAIKANHRLSDMEMHALCEALTELDDPFHCPHGRPVFIRMTQRDLDKGFRRIV